MGLLMQKWYDSYGCEQPFSASIWGLLYKREFMPSAVNLFLKPMAEEDLGPRDEPNSGSAKLHIPNNLLYTCMPTQKGNSQPKSEKLLSMIQRWTQRSQVNQDAENKVSGRLNLKQGIPLP